MCYQLFIITKYRITNICLLVEPINICMLTLLTILHILHILFNLHSMRIPISPLSLFLYIRLPSINLLHCKQQYLHTM